MSSAGRGRAHARPYKPRVPPRAAARLQSEHCRPRRTAARRRRACARGARLREERGRQQRVARQGVDHPARGDGAQHRYQPIDHKHSALEGGIHFRRGDNVDLVYTSAMVGLWHRLPSPAPPTPTCITQPMPQPVPGRQAGLNQTRPPPPSTQPITASPARDPSHQVCLHDSDPLCQVDGGGPQQVHLQTEHQEAAARGEGLYLGRGAAIRGAAMGVGAAPDECGRPEDAGGRAVPPTFWLLYCGERRRCLVGGPRVVAGSRPRVARRPENAACGPRARRHCACAHLKL